MCQIYETWKTFCPDSKGIPEQVIEDAFIESYRMLCTDHRDVLEEFIKRVEKTLSEDSIEDKIENSIKVLIISNIKERNY